jgi:hypothetical protein
MILCIPFQTNMFIKIGHDRRNCPKPRVNNCGTIVDFTRCCGSSLYATYLLLAVLCNIQMMYPKFLQFMFASI